MTDFEDRLATALRSAGDDAPDAAGLAPAARGRARARRRRTALTSVAAVVAVAGVVGGAALLGNRDTGRVATPASDGPTPTVWSSPPTPEAASRVESWRDISVTVPADWGHGHLSTWCLNGREHPGVPPVVDRPGAAEAIACNGPQNGFGILFSDGATFDAAEPPGKVWSYTRGDVQVYVEDSWMGYQRTDDAMVLVSAPTRAEAEAILASYVHNTSVDANGCAPNAADAGPALAEGMVRLCRYGIDDWLEQSELLTGRDAADALAALAAAPLAGDRMCTMALTGPVVQVTSADAQGRVTLDACQGFSWDGVGHDLTADVLYWTLSPGWSGGVDGDVPMPGKFRQ